MQANSQQTTLITDLKTSSISTETDQSALFQRLLTLLEITVESVREMALIVKRLDQLDADWTEFGYMDQSRLGYLRRIACGQVLPDVYVAFLGYSGLRNKISTLPISDQEKLANGGTVLVALGPDNDVLVKPCDMTQKQIKQVFGPSGIRSKMEQLVWMGSHRKTVEPEVATPVIEVCRKRNGIAVNGVFIPFLSLVSYVSTLGSK